MKADDDPWVACHEWAKAIAKASGMSRTTFAEGYDRFVQDRRAEAAVRSQPDAEVPDLADFLVAIATTRPPEGVAPLQGPGDDVHAFTLALFALGSVENRRLFLLRHVTEDVFKIMSTGPSAAGVGRVRKPRVSRMVAKGALDQIDAALERYVTDDDSVPVGLDWIDSIRLTQALTRANNRVALVQVYASSKLITTGTGFLVGPNALLTNYHVVDRAFKKESLKKDHTIKCFFSFGLSVEVSRLAGLIHKSPWQDLPGLNDAADLEAWRQNSAEHLDFACVSLERAAGLERGFYRLDEASEPMKGACYAIHHPNAQQRKISGGSIQPRVNQNIGSRLLHGAATAQGSSGGLILDRSGQPVGLHTGGMGVGRNRFGVAIPLIQIQRQLDTQPNAQAAIQAVKTPYVPRNTMRDGTPILARSRLLELFGTMLNSNVAVLRIVEDPERRGDGKLGRTFCAQVLGEAMAPGSRVWLRYEPATIPQNPEELVRQILRAIGDPEPERLPSRPNSEDAYVRVLADDLRQRLAVTSLQLWLVLDDLDRQDIVDTSIRAFLGRLYVEAHLTRQLKIVLIGVPQQILTNLGLTLQAVAPPTEGAATYAQFELAKIEHQEFKDAILEWLPRRQPDPAALPSVVWDVIASACAPDPDTKDPLVAVPKFIRERIHAHLG